MYISASTLNLYTSLVRLLLNATISRMKMKFSQVAHEIDRNLKIRGEDMCYSIIFYSICMTPIIDSIILRVLYRCVFHLNKI